MKSKNNFHEDSRLMWESYVNREADYEVPQDDDALARAKKRGYDEPSDADHHNQYMMDQDLLQPLHKAAQAAGADDINDYMIKQIKDQGDNWVEWFIDTVIGDEEDY